MTVKILARAAIVGALFPACAFAQTVTIETTLGERGFTDGIVLHGQDTSNVFVALPHGARMTNGRLVIDAQSVTPTLQRGSFSILVNGQPVDAVGLTASSGPVPLKRSIALRDDRLNGFDALSIGFKTDLRTDVDPCRDDFDPANSVTLLPASRLAFDVDMGKVRSVADAFALLPHRPLVQLPAQPTVSPEIATAALQLGVLLTARGLQPRFETARGDDLVAIRLGSVGDHVAGSPTIKIERTGNMVDIVIDPSSDFIALGRMLQAAPSALVGTQAALSLAPTVAAAQSQPVDDDFRTFSVLPPAQRIKRYGEWRLNFPLVASNGRLAEEALLKLFISPDWSGQRPIMTTYLNDQIVGADRPGPGQSDVTVALPVSLLRFSNTLRVTLERAGGERYCAASDQGQAAQLLPGSGLVLGHDKGTGFIRVANAFGTEGHVALPQSAAETSAIGPYLQFSSKVLASFGSHGRKLSVGFGPPASSGSGGTLRFEIVGTGGLILSMADQVELRELRYVVESPLAVLSTEQDGRTLLVQLSEPQDLPQPRSLYLGGGSKALIADTGVVWQASAPTVAPSIAVQLWEFGQSVFTRKGIGIALVGLGLIGLLLISRALIKTIFNRLRHRAGK